MAVALVVLAVPLIGQHLDDATLIDPAMSAGSFCLTRAAILLSAVRSEMV
jgi:hypothetical protein